MTMKRTQIYLTREQHQQLEVLAETRDTTMSNLIREAIAEYMARHLLVETDPLLDIIGLGESGLGDGSVQHDRDIYGD
ncbi:MAG: CopG family transcriptional regulator [Anaerolineae bacterium]